MNTEWSLNEIYKGFDAPSYEADFGKLEDAMKKEKELVKKADTMELKSAVEQLIAVEEEIAKHIGNLSVYIGLVQAADTENGDAMAQQNRLMKLWSEGSATQAAAQKIYARIPDIDAMAKESDLIQEYSFMLKQAKKQAEHLLSDEVEEMIAAMDITGGSAWGNLFSYLTSTVKVDYQGKEITLSEVRNLAYSPDAKVRKEAYEAEIASYEKIQDSIAFALNNIKNQFAMICEKKGYASPLDMTLEQSRMSRKTLDAMMTAIQEYLPVFHKYMRKKAEMLGYSNGLPWYELFAPMGKSDTQYSLEEAKECLVNNFQKFSPDMADMMKEAFENQWIDFYPRKGKEGGAFCAGVPSIKQSRILTNYDGYFGSIRTLAHELGHAYHNVQVQTQRVLNQDYPMPVAETASTFNETHLIKAALKEATNEEKLNLLENSLMEHTQVIVDIYSRYLFETAVFEQCQNKFLMAEDCKKIMEEAQKKAYGDGLDSNYLHPYMWACKSHYYSSGLSFYNFPYAFGGLFALGLYSKFEEEGADFVPKYKAMLHATPVCTVEEAAAMEGIDLTTPDFWRQSLSQIEELVEEFCKL
ncbi:M3 family oligoendopeptidase [Roseburia sp. 499]|uniref:M3 family oligoendopeptidase n=1 Tax=Roseburia sp. 499 TaxID=1261634 RepID=UPI000951B95F|nr:M3 family oligoendopeptidase [Roseburia sp. 499]WVK69544.1 M3 family oligoendopeptidase [Roseburia sp. 499]